MMKGKFKESLRASMDETAPALNENKTDKVVLVGSPNVGKSVIFNALTGIYVTVSNYPGTTVETTRGKSEIDGRRYEIIDTPGMYSLLPITEDERVSRNILLDETPSAVIHVVDAKNLKKMLPFTLQLIEAGLPVILVLNFMDEVKRLGIKIDMMMLEKILGVPVIGTVATQGKCIDQLKAAIGGYGLTGTDIKSRRNESDLDESISGIEALLKSEYGLSKRAVSSLLLMGDEEIITMVRENDKESYDLISEIIAETKKGVSMSINYLLRLERQKKVNDICNDVVNKEELSGAGLREKLDMLTLNPVVGVPLFILVIYAMYKFVGVFGAQTVVDFLEATLFEKYLTPFTNGLFEAIIPWPVLQDLFVH